MITFLTILALLALFVLFPGAVLAGLLVAAATPLTIWPSVALTLAASILLSTSK